MMKTSVLTLRKADWKRTENEIIERIRALKEMVEKLEPSIENDTYANDAILPLLELLGAFIDRIVISEDTVSLFYVPQDDNDPAPLPDHGRDL